jgi:hypothetical protein
VKYVFGSLLIFGGIVLAAWLGGYVMLYRGIAEVISHPNAGSILKAVFCGGGMIPGFLLIVCGVAIMDS